MRELAAAVVGALVGSLATLLWEAVLRPREERKSIAAALNSEVAFNLLMLDRYRGLSSEASDNVPLDFAAATTVYKSLASRLGELPPDLAFVLASHYSALEAASSIPSLFAEQDNVRRSGGPDSVLALREQRRMAERFHKLLRSAQTSCALAHVGLSKLAPSVTIGLPDSPTSDGSRS